MIGDPLGERQQPFPANTAAVEANRCLYCFDAPCMIACPTSIDIPSFIKSIATGDEIGAAHTILEANVLGASCGRVCETDALCEGACVLGPQGKPIEIGRLQREATDTLRLAGGSIPYAAGPDSGRSVAIVGGGPAGLSAAAHLRSLGHAVTIYDRNEKLGGLAAFGIIPLRQPNEIIEWEVEQILSLGVTARCGVTVGSDIAVDELLDGHDAVLLTTGAGRYVHDIELENAGASGVEDALVFIEKSRTLPTHEMQVGSKVIVVGGGNTAMDACAIAVSLRQGSVTCVYRRTAEEMTAYHTEVDFCLREGVGFRFLTQPVALVADEAGRVSGIECVRVELGAPDESGRRRPVLSDERFVLEADHILLATGQKREPALLNQLGLELTTDGRPVVDEQRRTSVARVYACGDAVLTGAKLSVVDAVDQGRIAARGIDAALVPVSTMAGGARG